MVVWFGITANRKTHRLEPGCVATDTSSWTRHGRLVCGDVTTKEEEWARKLATCN